MLRTITLAIGLFVGLLPGHGAIAATTDVTRDTEGVGATQQEAVANALVEAVRQVRGSAAGVDRSLKETMTLVTSGNGALVTRTAEPVADVYTVSRGFVRSYRVLEQQATDKGVRVRIRAVVPVFESAVSDAGRQRIAVLPFRVDDTFRLTDHGNPSAFSQRLADRLVSELSRAPDVVVVNRDFLAELSLEKTVLAADAAPEELTKLGASVGADFLLVGRIVEARTETGPGAYGGRPKQTDEVRLSWRLVETATGKVLRAGDLAVDQARKPARPFRWSRRDDFEAGELFAALATRIADTVLARASPSPESGNTPPSDTTPPALTPGSGEAPLRW